MKSISKVDDEVFQNYLMKRIRSSSEVVVRTRSGHDNYGFVNGLDDEVLTLINGKTLKEIVILRDAIDSITETGITIDTLPPLEKGKVQKYTFTIHKKSVDLLN